MAIIIKPELRSDASIRNDVCKELEWNPRLEEASITVHVKDRIVSLTGAVNSYACKLAACSAAHSIAGVQDVVDETVVTVTNDATTDRELAQAVRLALIWDVYVPDECIRSTVSHGWVILEGEVDNWGALQDATRAVERLTGVRGISNRITVRTTLAASAKIKESIELALARQTEREARRIQVDVHEGVVKLTGKVRSHREKTAVTELVAHARGIQRVEDGIVVDPLA